MYQEGVPEKKGHGGASENGRLIRCSRPMECAETLTLGWSVYSSKVHPPRLTRGPQKMTCRVIMYMAGKTSTLVSRDARETPLQVPARRSCASVNALTTFSCTFHESWTFVEVLATSFPPSTLHPCVPFVTQDNRLQKRFLLPLQTRQYTHHTTIVLEAKTLSPGGGGC